MGRISRGEFQEYLDSYFNHTYPEDLEKIFGLSKSNHSRRIRGAIDRGMTLSNGTQITNELYEGEKIYQDYLQILEILQNHPDLIDRLAKLDHARGPNEGRWTSEETSTLLEQHAPKASYDHINLDRTESQMKSKYFYEKNKIINQYVQE